MKTNMGTPKTLSEAIQNGWSECAPGDGEPEIMAEITKHVLDFLRQKFGASYLSAPDETAFCTVRSLAEALGVTEKEETDPTPYCAWCGAKYARYCDCGPRAEND